MTEPRGESTQIVAENETEKILTQLKQTLNNRDIEYIKSSEDVARSLKDYDKIKYMNPIILASAVIYYRITSNTFVSIDPRQVLNNEVENVIKTLGSGTSVDLETLSTRIAVNILAYADAITPYISRVKSYGL
jgi:hypothetical protein